MISLEATFIVFGVAFISGCGADSDTPSPPIKSNQSVGAFHVEIEGLIEFDHNSAKAKSFTYRNKFWEFESKDAKLRMAARFPDLVPGVEQYSIDLEHNNVTFEFKHVIGKQTTRVSCQAAQEPTGQIKRTIHDDLSSSGTFEIELVRCRNAYNSEKVDKITTPVIVKGKFENSPHKASLY